MNKWEIIGAIASLFLWSCAPKEATRRLGTHEEVVVVDALAREVRVVVAPSRVVSGNILPFVPAWYVASGQTSSLVGVHPDSYEVASNTLLPRMSPEILSASSRFLQGGLLNIEELLMLDPQVYIESELLMQNIDKVVEVGIPTLAIQARMIDQSDPLETLNSWLDLMARVMEDETRVAHFHQFVQESYDRVAQGLADITEDERVRVVFIHTHTGALMRVTGSGFFGNQWITVAGGIPITESDVVRVQEVSMEQIYRWNPQVIIMTNFSAVTPEDLLANRVAGQDWSVVDAVQNGRVYATPTGIYRWASANGDAPLMFLWLAQKLYPYRFGYDMSEEARVYYRDFYGYALSDDELSMMSL